ncbi:unnamed protein product [Closterium sp. NIES-53]
MQDASSMAGGGVAIGSWRRCSIPCVCTSGIPVRGGVRGPLSRKSILVGPIVPRYQSALVAELFDFAAAYRLDYLASVVSDPNPACPPSVGGEVALGCDVLEERQEKLECLAAAAPQLATMLLAPEGDPDALDIPTPRSYREAISGTYVDEVPPPGANIISGMWIFIVKRPLGSPPAFKARYVARGFKQPQRDYELHSLDFSTAFLQAYGDHFTACVRHLASGTTLAALGFAPSTADQSLFLRTDTTLVYVDDLVFATADMEALALVKVELQERHTCTDLGPSALRLLVLFATSHSSVYQPIALSSTFGQVLVLTGHSDAFWADDQATQHSSQGYTFSLGFGFVSWRSTHSSYVLGSSSEAEIYAGAMAAQELRWLTYLLSDLGERPRSPPVLYQRRQLRLSYVASRANTADAFTNALGSGDHQRFYTALGLVPTLPHLLVA